MPTVKSPQVPKNDKNSVHPFKSVPPCYTLLFDFLLKVAPTVLSEQPEQKPAPKLPSCKAVNTTKPSGFNKYSLATKTLSTCIWVSDEGQSVQV